ncbi:MAG: HAD family hydrolase [Bacteroidota bacterium]
MNLIVFDIDDTLTKSEKQHQMAFVNAMKDFSILSIDKNWKSYAHHTDSHILKVNYENNLPQKFDFSFIESFEARMMEYLKTYEEVNEITGAKEMLKDLIDKSKYAIAFATGSLLKPALLKLEQAGLDIDANLVTASNAIYEREGIVKQAIERAQELNRVDSFENIISVGDGIWDLKTAENLGLHFIGIGKKNFEDFKKENIKVHIDNWLGFDLHLAERQLGIEVPI